jgi:HAD superfamily hydrolase (TIGR01509 family)
MIQALIFDMDGVIVDSELHWKSVEGFYLQSLVPGWSTADQGKIIGLSLDNLFSMLTDEYGFTGTKSEFLVQYHAMAEAIYREKVNLLPGFSELLSLLREKQVPVALASSSPHNWIDLVMEKFDLRDAFQVVVSAQDTGGAGKPAPDIYLYTARKLEVEPRDCVVIEDSQNGVLSAKQAGMYCIGLRNGFNEEQDLSEADTIVEGLGQVDWDMLSEVRKESSV